MARATTEARPRSGMKRRVYLVDGARTPFLKSRGRPGPFTPVDLAVQCGRPLLLRQPSVAEAIDMTILGCVNVIADEVNPARVAALRLGLDEEMVAFTVQINCGSGMQSIDTAFRYIQDGSADIVLAGGAEALSHAPLVIRRDAADWFGRFSIEKSAWRKAKRLTELRPRFFKPIVGLERGLTDPIVNLNMGQTAEVIAHLFSVTREQADQYAVTSHSRLAQAQDAGFLKGEVIPIVDREGNLYERDDGVRPDTSVEKLAGLSPAFEKPYGQVTPGNSSQITDGASWTILASEAAVDKHQLAPFARIVDSQWSALDPSIMGLAPTLCVTALLKRNGLARDDVDLWEINEAFAAQVLACLAAWKDEAYCKEGLGLDGPFGLVEHDRLNVDGGAVALGHPVGASGNRITLHLANAMKRIGAKRGVATECIGGGQGGAILVEAI